jgi:rhamnulokinase
MSGQAHIAVDLGAESGRVLLGALDGPRLALHDAHRFRHLPVPTPAGLCWDLTGLWQQILLGLRNAATLAQALRLHVASIGVDAWGVDWSLVSDQGVLLGLPRCYRDPTFHAAFARVTKTCSPQNIYAATGIQLMPINSLYQLEDRFRQAPDLFAAPNKLLFIPDLIHWLLTGRTAVERTVASTSQMLDARTGTWNLALLNQLALPTTMLCEPIDPGETISTLRADVAHATGLTDAVRVIAPPSHDTAAAVAAVPAQPDSHWCYLSSGTWSLLGVELDAPCITPEAFNANFTNELGVGGTVRFLKNLSGLWLVQETRRNLERDGTALDYAELTAQAEAADPFRTLIPVSDPVFAAPGGMIDKLRAYARQTDQPLPQTPGQLVRCCLESLAMAYRQAAQTLQTLLRRRLSVLHIVGGGCQNMLLNRMTADATCLRVVAGPAEATAMGNLLTQAIGLGHVADLAHARRIVAASSDLTRIEPDARAASLWERHQPRYLSLPPFQRPSDFIETS